MNYRVHGVAEQDMTEPLSLSLQNVYMSLLGKETFLIDTVCGYFEQCFSEHETAGITS